MTSTITFEVSSDELTDLAQLAEGRGKNVTIPKATLGALIRDHRAAVERLNPEEYREPGE